MNAEIVVVECPKCGCKDPMLFDKQLEYDLGDPFHHRQPLDTRYTYLCKCGLAFTFTGPVEQRPDQANVWGAPASPLPNLAQ